MTLDCTCDRLREAEAKAAMWDGLVRCGDCKHYDMDVGFCLRFKEVFDHHYDLEWQYQIAEWGYLESSPDDFCAWGVRREDA